MLVCTGLPFSFLQRNWFYFHHCLSLNTIQCLKVLSGLQDKVMNRRQIDIIERKNKGPLPFSRSYQRLGIGKFRELGFKRR